MQTTFFGSLACTCETTVGFDRCFPSTCDLRRKYRQLGAQVAVSPNLSLRAKCWCVGKDSMQPAMAVLASFQVGHARPPLGCAGTKEHRPGRDEHHSTVNTYIGNWIGTHPLLSTMYGEALPAPAAAPGRQLLCSKRRLVTHNTSGHRDTHNETPENRMNQTSLNPHIIGTLAGQLTKRQFHEFVSCRHRPAGCSLLQPRHY